MARVFDRAHALLECLDGERLLHSATRERANSLRQAYAAYDAARAKIEEDYIQRDSHEHRLNQNDPVRWLMDSEGYKCKALDDIATLCKSRGLTLSRWKNKSKSTNSTTVRWAAHTGLKATRLAYQTGVVAWVEIAQMEYVDEAASAEAFADMLEMLRSANA